jgi:hypothetical protein
VARSKGATVRHAPPPAPAGGEGLGGWHGHAGALRGPELCVLRPRAGHPAPPPLAPANREYPPRYAPVQILANSVSATVKNHGQLSPTIGLVLMVAYTAAALIAGAAVFMSRDA